MRNYVNKRRTVSSKMRPPDVDLTTWRSLVTLTTVSVDKRLIALDSSENGRQWKREGNR